MADRSAQALAAHEAPPAYLKQGNQELPECQTSVVCLQHSKLQGLQVAAAPNKPSGFTHHQGLYGMLDKRLQHSHGLQVQLYPTSHQGFTRPARPLHTPTRPARPPLNCPPCLHQSKGTRNYQNARQVPSVCNIPNYMDCKRSCTQQASKASHGQQGYYAHHPDQQGLSYNAQASKAFN